jgi:Flp pilus assembly protein TadG
MRNFRQFLTFLREQSRDESGASTVEFVILLPFLIGFLGLVATASLYLALSSDVQQLAHELARAALPDAQSTDTEAECDALGDRWVSPLATNLPLLQPERVTGVSCQVDPSTRILRVAVNYDTRGTLGNILGSVIGLRYESFSRSSFVRW